MRLERINILSGLIQKNLMLPYREPQTRIKMLKSSKLSHKSHKSSKDSIRKGHLSKKSLHSRSPVRLSGSSRPPPMKPISPGMKRGHPIPKRKASHSPRLRSIASSPHRSISHRSKPESPVSIDRIRTMKGLKYEKRKHLSNSPVRHLGPSSPRRPLQHEVHDVPPYHAERYPSSSAVAHSAPYSPPTRKKIRREAEHYFASRSVSTSPPRRHMVDPLHSQGHIPPRVENSPPALHHKQRRGIPVVSEEREKHAYSMRNKHESPPIMPRNHSKDVPLKIPYPNESSRYRSPSPANRYLPGSTKSYGPTLHERFSSVIESNRTEPRIRYSREDLQKITIDIKGDLRNRSPTLRHIMNPSEMKLAHRANEGHRPLFDREEIKQAPRDLREDAYYDRRTGSYNSAHTVDLRVVENYQITRHRYEGSLPSSSGRSLNDRWQNHEGKKAISLDRDEREKDYGKIPPLPRSYIDTRSRSRSGDRDFRERYLDTKPSTSRAEYASRPPLDSVDSRNSNPYPHRKSTLPIDARHKLNTRKGERESHPTSMRPDVKDHYLNTDRHYPEPVSSSRVERREYHSPLPEPHKWDYKSRSPSREKFSDFPRRPDKYSYKSWPDKPDVSPKSMHYLEPETREGSTSFRGGSRPFHNSRGFRSRGSSRGSTFYRGSFRGSYRNSSSPRARGAFRR